MAGEFRLHRKAPPTPVTQSRFPGDPGVGKLYQGTSVDGGASTGTDDRKAFSAYVTKFGRPLSVARLYNGGVHIQDRTTYHTSRGRIPHWTITPPNDDARGAPSWANMADDTAGARSWANKLGAEMAAAGGVVWVTLLHEPEDNLAGDNTTAQADYRQAKRWLRWYWDYQLGLTNVAFYDACWMMITFDSGSDRVWWNWHADWMGTTAGGSTEFAPVVADFHTGTWTAGSTVANSTGSAVDIHGADVYNWWGRRAGDDWKQGSERASRWMAIINKLWPDAAKGVAEYGCQAFVGDWTFQNPDYSAANKKKTQDWFRNFYQYALDNGIVSLEYFHSGPMFWLTSEKDPQEWRWTVLRELADLPTTVTPAQAP